MKEILLTSSVLILAIALLRALFHSRVTKHFQYALWGLVLLRLLVPVQFGSLSFSVSSLAQDSQPIAVISQQISQPLAKPDYDMIYQDVQREYENKGYDLTKPEIVTQITQETQKRIDLPTWEDVLKVIWYAGIAAMAVWFTAVNLRFQRSARKNAVRLDISTPVPVYVSPGVTSPCLTGLFRPYIYLTPACAEDERLRRHVLTHEITHYRHGDHIWSLLRSLCLCLYWFDPLVWLAAILSRRDCELACDEGALKRLGEDERIGYGRSLLDVIAGDLSPSHLMEAATAMNESKRQLTERVNRIVKKPKFYVTSAIGLFIAAAIIAGCTFAGNTPKPDPEKDEYLLLETVTQYHSHDGFPESTGWTRHYYDTQGHLTAIVSKTDNIIASTEVECDENGNPIRKTLTDENGAVTTVTEYTYDADGNELTCKINIGMESAWETDKTYDSRGNLVTLTDPVSRVEYTYDSRDRLILTESYVNGKADRREEYSYSEDGLTCTITVYNSASNAEVGKTVQTKSADGLSAEYVTTLSDGTEEQRCVYTYDEAGNCILQQLWQQGELYMTVRSRYIRPGEAAVYTLTSLPEDAVPDGTAPEETVPQPTGAQPVPDNRTAASLVTTWMESDLEWEDSVGNNWHFKARIPTIYPFSNDAIAINQHIIEKYGAMLEEVKTASKEGYSAYPLSIDYKAYTTADTLSLVITTDTGHDYIDYEVFNFYLEPGEFAVTMDDAAMAKYFLNISYPEFLYAATQFSKDAFYAEYAEADSETLDAHLAAYKHSYGAGIDGNPFAMRDLDLYTDENGQIILKFDLVSMAGADHYPTLRYFDPMDTTAEESYHWLFNLRTDGAAATCFGLVLCDAFLADPEEFEKYISLESERIVADVAMLMTLECGPEYAGAIREALASLPDSTFKTLTLKKLDEYYP